MSYAWDARTNDRRRDACNNHAAVSRSRDTCHIYGDDVVSSIRVPSSPRTQQRRLKIRPHVPEERKGALRSHAVWVRAAMSENMVYDHVFRHYCPPSCASEERKVVIGSLSSPASKWWSEYVTIRTTASDNRQRSERAVAICKFKSMEYTCCSIFAAVGAREREGLIWSTVHFPKMWSRVLEGSCGHPCTQQPRLKTWSYAHWCPKTRPRAKGARGSRLRTW